MRPAWPFVIAVAWLLWVVVLLRQGFPRSDPWVPTVLS